MTPGEDDKSSVGPVLLYTRWCNGHCEDIMPLNELCTMSNLKNHTSLDMVFCITSNYIHVHIVEKNAYLQVYNLM